MKHLISIFAALISVVSSAQFVDTSVRSIAVQNVIGVQKIVSEREYTPIAVNYGETAVVANTPVNRVRYATNLVFTANLEADDQLFVYDHARGGYVTYRLNADKKWEPETVFSASDSGKDLEPSADQTQAWGYGFWLRRHDITNRVDKTIYLAGQVPVGEVSVTLAPSTSSTYSKTLIGNPLGTAWNLNDKSVFDWSSVATEDDHIQLNNAEATLYYWRKVAGVCGWKKVSGVGDGTIPAGASFWYVRAKPKSGTTQEPITIRFRTGL